MQSDYITEKQAADYLQLSIHSLRGYRYKDRGPAFYQTGKGGPIRYKTCDLDKYVESFRVEPSKY